MNSIFEMLTKIISVAKEAIDRQGLIAILTISVNNDHEYKKRLKVKLCITNLSISYDLISQKIRIIDLTSIAIFDIKKKPNDTVLIEMMIKVFHIKRFNSERFVFKANGWQKINGDELQGMISKMI